MKIYRIFLVCFIFFPFRNEAVAQDVGILHLPPLHLALPANWSFDPTRQPIEGHGPKGEKALISILRKRSSNPSEPLPSTQEAAWNFAQANMGELASKGGKTVVRAVSAFAVPEGKTGYSSGSESSMLGRKNYFIQYLFSAPGVIIYFTFEGDGEALPAMQQFDALFNTQYWDE